ncbi:MAG TPA: DUF4388 domain-containing protein [Acidimicrobiales bacterium]|nr:DUF4388 domain-containing protein [Acidimicrobiales bacterium]
MSLHGTLETFALPDVLALLAATKKDGELHVVGGTTDGRVWFQDGNVVEADVGAATSLVDAVFELLRLESGKFSFDADKSPPSPGEPAAIQPLLDEAQARLAEWRSIEAVVPSVTHGVRLLSEVKAGPITVTGDQWRALVGVATAPTVQSVIERLGLGEFETCRTLKALVEAGLVAVEERAVPPAPPTPSPAPPPPQPLPAPAAEKPRIQALTSTPAASAAELEVQPASPPVAAPEPVAEPAKAAKPAKAPTPPTPAPEAPGEAAELVRQVAALDTTAPAPVAEPPTAEAAPEGSKGSEASDAPDAPTAEGEEPINRGLLLKFLSSVRT